jgi:hypothetical protein
MTDFEERFGYGTVAHDQDKLFNYEAWRVQDDKAGWTSPWARLGAALRRKDLERVSSKPFAVDYFDRPSDGRY